MQIENLFFVFGARSQGVIRLHAIPELTGHMAPLVVALVVVSLYFLGASVPETAEGVASATGRGALVALKTGAEAVGGGVWVLHSSGGYILNRGGKYVGGTLRSAPP